MWNKYIIQTVSYPIPIKISDDKNCVMELILFQKYFPGIFMSAANGRKGDDAILQQRSGNLALYSSEEFLSRSIAMLSLLKFQFS